MIILPDVKPYTRVIRPGAPTQQTLPVYMALKRGLKLFKERDFTCTILKDHERDYSVLHMSSIGHCGRKEFIHLHDTQLYSELEESLRVRIPPPFTAWHMGHIVEAYTLWLLELGGLSPFDFQRELFDLNKRLVGHIDALVQMKETQYLIEVKGLRHESVELLLAHGVQKAIPYYFDQMQIYMFNLNIQEGYLIVLDKDTSMYYIEHVPQDAARVAFLRKKALAIYEVTCVENLPEEFIVRDCRFCPLMEKCGEIEGRETFIQNFVTYERTRP